MVRPDSQLTPEERAFLQSLWQQPVAEDEDRDYLCRLMPEGNSPHSGNGSPGNG